MTTEEKIERIRTFVPRLREVVVGLSAEELTTQYNPPEWTIAQNVHHLVDSHLNAYLRYKMILTQDNANLIGYNQEAFAEMVDGSEATLEHSLRILDGLHQRWARMLSSITDWNKSGTHTEYGEISLAGMLDIYAHHGDGHIQQIQEVLDKMP